MGQAKDKITQIFDNQLQILIFCIFGMVVGGQCCFCCGEQKPRRLLKKVPEYFSEATSEAVDKVKANDGIFLQKDVYGILYHVLKDIQDFRNKTKK